jgi:hypothetical protein
LPLRTTLNLVKAELASRTLFSDFGQSGEDAGRTAFGGQMSETVMKLISYVMRFVKHFSQVGRKYVYKQSFGEKYVTTTLFFALGISIRCMVIFNGVRTSYRLAETHCLH